LETKKWARIDALTQIAEWIEIDGWTMALMCIMGLKEEVYAIEEIIVKEDI